jgi:histidine triad (HIT) family protein
MTGVTAGRGEVSASVDPDCLFCKIVAGAVSSNIVAESALSVAFRDLHPQAPTHALVIPKRHSPTLPELAEADPESAVDVLRLARRVATEAGVEAGYRLVANNGAAAQQTVFHAHVHVIGGRELSWPPG